MEDKHRVERRQLADEITRLKKTVTKGDKKRMKAVKTEILKLEQELESKHAAEIESLEKSIDNDNLLVNNMANIHMTTDNMPTCKNGNDTQSQKSGKGSRANRRREKKSDLEASRNERIIEQDKLNTNSSRILEFNKISSLLSSLNLQLFEIASDGDCLYNAIAHQLNQNRIRFPSSENESEKSWCAASLRKVASLHMESAPDTYIPFLSSINNPELPMDIDEFSSYCDKVANTHEWGGQLELRAISTSIRKSIRIIQADGPSLVIGEEYGDPLLTITYHRFAYGLGEHYNSSQSSQTDDIKPSDSEWTTVA